MARNVILQPNTITVLRASDFVALLDGCENYQRMPGSKLSVLPDSATVADVLAAINAWSQPAPLPPTA